jgi:hypothetical protein
MVRPLSDETWGADDRDDHRSQSSNCFYLTLSRGPSHDFSFAAQNILSCFGVDFSSAVEAPISRLQSTITVADPCAAFAIHDKAVQSVTGVAAGAIGTAFAETKDEIDKYLPDKPAISYDGNLFCAWFKSPTTIRPGADYAREKAKSDQEKAAHFLTTEIRTGSNPLNLYDDIDGAFVVSLFGNSDAGCFHILSEYKRTITSNVLVLAVIFSVIVSAVAITTVVWPKGIDLQAVSGLADTGNIELPIIRFELNEKILFNNVVLGLVSCFAAYLLMSLYYYTTYKPFQINNMREMRYFLVRYLGDINSNFRTIVTESTRAAVEEKDAVHVKEDIVLWITNLQWMAFRAFFIEYFVRDIYFQIRRNSIYSLIIVPLIFIFALVGAAYAFDITEFKIVDVGRTISPQIGFYVVFATLLVGYWRYLRKSFLPLEATAEDEANGEWYGFHKLNLLNAMTEVMESYVSQLESWRKRYGGVGTPHQ